MLTTNIHSFTMFLLLFVKKYNTDGKKNGKHPSYVYVHVCTYDLK